VKSVSLVCFPISQRRGQEQSVVADLTDLANLTDLLRVAEEACVANSNIL